MTFFGWLVLYALGASLVLAVGAFLYDTRRRFRDVSCGDACTHHSHRSGGGTAG